MFDRRGIILAGGHGTRLYPLTKVLSKQLMPVFDRPLIFFPIATLMNAGITDILIITTPRDLSCFKDLLGDGSEWGLRLSYKIQREPKGIAEALLIGEEFIGNSSIALILGDNIFNGGNFNDTISAANLSNEGCFVFLKQHDEPNKFGVANLSSRGKLINVEEKPKMPESNLVVTGLYYFDNKAIKIAKSLTPSSRGELEIVDVINAYANNSTLQYGTLTNSVTWMDAGTHESLLDAGNLVYKASKSQIDTFELPLDVAKRKCLVV